MRGDRTALPCTDTHRTCRVWNVFLSNQERGGGQAPYCLRGSVLCIFLFGNMSFYKRASFTVIKYSVPWYHHYNFFLFNPILKIKGWYLGMCNFWMRKHHKLLALYLTRFYTWSCSQAPVCASSGSRILLFKIKQTYLQCVSSYRVFNSSAELFGSLRVYQNLLLISYITHSG